MDVIKTKDVAYISISLIYKQLQTISYDSKDQWN